MSLLPTEQHDALHRWAEKIPAPAPSTNCSERGALLSQLRELLAAPRNFEDADGNGIFSDGTIALARDLMPRIDALDTAERTAWDEAKAAIKAALQSPGA